jgi:hypothetical protein
MRSLCVPSCLIAALAFVAGCEDGPNQPFSPAPASAGSVWVAPSTDAAVGQGGQAYDAGYPTTGKTTLCSTDFKRQRWAWMLAQPIRPPRFYAGIDLAGGDLWNGLTIGQAEAPPGDPNADGGGLCQSVPLGAGGTCPSGFGACDQNYWGNNQEVSFSWNVATHLLDQQVISLGYTGSFSTAAYPDNTGAMHSYTLTPGDVARRDGQPYILPWTGNPAQEITNIFNAGMASYASIGGIAWDTSTCSSDTTCTNNEVCQCTHDTTNTANCVAGTKGQCGDANCSTDGYCLVYAGSWIFGIRPLAFYVQGTAGVPQPALSTPTGFYNFWVKWEPFSYLPQDVELGPNGPQTSGTPTGAPANSNITCNQHIGQTFGDFQSNCVQVHGDKSNPNGVDVVNLNKVVNGLTHDQEHWTANVLGVNQNFTSLKVANNPGIVVQDTDTPQSGDIAQDFTYDIRARGHTYNDYNKTSGAAEFRASSLIFIEWARLLLADVAKILGLAKPHILGDPLCTGFDASGQPNYKVAGAGKGCSGIEGLIIPGYGPVGPAIYGAGNYGTGSGCATGVAPCFTDFSSDPLRPDLDPGYAQTIGGSENWDYDVGWYAPVIKPSGLTGALCIDPSTQTDCTDTVYPQNLASIWQNMFNHVIRVLGNGNVNSLPPEMQDYRYYYRWFGLAFTRYLKAYGNYNPATRDQFPSGVAGQGLGPSDVMTQPIDQETLFFDYAVSRGVGAAQAFDKFEYVDRDFIGTGAGGTYNWVPWDFEYGTDLLGGNQRYDNWFRRMDREEIAMYSAMLVDKTKTPGTENNVNITNLAGSNMLASGWPTWQCATGQYTDPTVMGGNECGGAYPPLDPTDPSGAPACAPGSGPCATGGNCIYVGKTYESGGIAVCGAACNYATFPTTGCGPSQACVLDGAGSGKAGCVDMKMDRNGPNPCTDSTGKGVACPAPSTVAPHPLLWYYPGAWNRTPFGLGHSPITLAQADKQAGIGVAKITIPNFASGPYTPSPIAATAADGGSSCPMGYSLSTNKVWCNASLNSGTGTTAPSFTPLTPWLEVGGGETENGGPVGFAIPQDGQRDQFLTTGQLDFTGVLESYVVDYVPYVDPLTPSCVATGTCNAGFACDGNSHLCVTDDNTIRIEAFEGADFLGQAFICQDPLTGDILHVGMYDSASSILAWLGAHLGADSSGVGAQPSAQTACSIIVRRSPYNNAINEIASLTNGVELNFAGGQGQGRVTDIVLFDTNLIQSF